MALSFSSQESMENILRRWLSFDPDLRFFAFQGDERRAAFVELQDVTRFIKAENNESIESTIRAKYGNPKAPSIWIPEFSARCALLQFSERISPKHPLLRFAEVNIRSFLERLLVVGQSSPSPTTWSLTSPLLKELGTLDTAIHTVATLPYEKKEPLGKILLIQVISLFCIMFAKTIQLTINFQEQTVNLTIKLKDPINMADTVTAKRIRKLLEVVKSSELALICIGQSIVGIGHFAESVPEEDQYYISFEGFHKWSLFHQNLKCLHSKDSNIHFYLPQDHIKPALASFHNLFGAEPPQVTL